jgi:glyoxylase-like metal-dependent hydrolase (beta-lactamase superfamily II)
MVVGGMKTNCYIIGSKPNGEAVVIDAGDEAQAILDKVKELGLKVKYIINTHGHPDGM